MALPGMSDDRYQTMNLATRGAPSLSNAKKEFKDSLKLGPHDGRHTNMVHDIQGAQPAALYKNTNRPSLYHPGDIRGTSSKTLHRDTNGPHHVLKVDDIEGAQPHPYTFKTERTVDPLMPAYKLPSYKASEHPEPKFLRDAHSVHDIEGTKSRPLYPMAMRNNHTADDIEGAQSGWRPRHARARLDAAPISHQYDVRDITDVGFKSQRTTCPLEPEYRINGMVIRDDAKYTKPKPLPAPATHDFFTLKTDDIEGAWPGWVPPHECRPPVDERRHFRNTNFVGDIAGAAADSVKHAIQTKRVVNPLDPTYDSLDGDRLRPPLTPNLLNGDPAKFGLHQPDAHKDRGDLAPPRMQQQGHHQSGAPQTMVIQSSRGAASARGSQPASARSQPATGRGHHGASTAASTAASARFVPPVDFGRAQGLDAKDAEIARLEAHLGNLKFQAQMVSGRSGGAMASGRASFRGSGNQEAATARQQMTQMVASARGSARQPMASARQPMASARGSARSGGSTAASRRETARINEDIAAVRGL